MGRGPTPSPLRVWWQPWRHLMDDAILSGYVTLPSRVQYITLQYITWHDIVPHCIASSQARPDAARHAALLAPVAAPPVLARRLGYVTVMIEIHSDATK